MLHKRDYFSAPLSIQGQTLTEVIVVSTVGILVVTALTLATIFSLRNASSSKNESQATKLAQEGIERVRTGRDRNSAISITGVSVTSWDGSGTACSGVPSIKTDSIWCYKITAAGGCDNPASMGGTDGKCYFNIDPTNQSLTNIGFAFVSTSLNLLPSLSETIPSGSQVFKRVVLLSDDTNYTAQKIITVIVQWTDFSGTHQSQLSTYLRKL